MENEEVRAPIIISEYNSNWPIQFEKEKKEILKILGNKIEIIEHIGSTSVVGLGSKPIIDILIGVKKLENANQCIKPLIALGYEYIKKHEIIFPNRRFFTKRSRSKGRTHHIHMVKTSSDFFQDHILFRDYLINHPNHMRKYFKLKKNLEEKYKNDREKYTESKAEFILTVLDKAKKEYSSK